jgi:quercetin dioxygenase-like cupin family protein
MHYRSKFLIATLASLSMLSSYISAAEKASSDTVLTPLQQHTFADIAGKEGVMLTVEYAPGASTPKHKHDAHTFVYVLEGAIEMQVEGGKKVILEAGQTFYESPTDVHSLSKNASTTKPAKFLVFFVKNKDTPPLMPVE